MPTISNLADYGMIANSVKDELLTPEQTAMQGQQLKSLALGNQAQEMKNSAGKKQMEADALIQQSIQKNAQVDPATGQVKINHAQVAADLANAGHVDKAYAYMDQQQKVVYEKHKDSIEQIARAANGVLSVSPESRPTAYMQTLAQLKQNGVDTTGAPEQYTPQTEEYLKQIINQAVDSKTHFEGDFKQQAEERKAAADAARAESENRRTDAMIRLTDARVNKIDSPASTPQQNLKPIPPAAQKTIIENAQTLKTIDDAITLNSGGSVGGLKGSAEATGLVKGMTPNFILNRVDSEGNLSRSAIADLKSAIIHDRSGAAVTLGEMSILKPFLPSESDDQKTVIEKLKRLKQKVQNEASLYEQTYNSEQGYKPSPILEGGSGKGSATPGIISNTPTVSNW